MSDARLRNLERELLLDPAHMDLHAEHARVLERAGRADEALAALDLAWRLGRLDLEPELRERLQARRVVEGGLGFRYIPAGPFLMGSDAGDSDEAPAHLVRLSAFHVAERVVIWGDLESWSGLRGHDEHMLRYSRDRAVTSFAFNRVQDALIGLSESRRPGKPRYQLLTEAQWERVRRVSLLGAGAASIYGIDVGDPPEWTADFYDSTTYDRGPCQDPAGPPGGEDLVVRGSFPGASFVQRATYRESADAAGSFEGHDRAHPWKAAGLRRHAARRLPSLMGIAFRPAFGAGAG